MDDEDELKDFNLSSRVEREERRRQRERGRLERELERERARDRGEAPDVSGGSRDWGTSDGASRSGETVDVELSTHAAGPRPGGARSRSDKPAGGLHGAERFSAGSAGQAGASARQAVATEALEEAWAAPSGMRSDRKDDETTECALLQCGAPCSVAACSLQSGDPARWRPVLCWPTRGAVDHQPGAQHVCILSHACAHRALHGLVVGRNRMRWVPGPALWRCALGARVPLASSRGDRAACSCGATVVLSSLLFGKRVVYMSHPYAHSRCLWGDPACDFGLATQPQAAQVWRLLHRGSWLSLRLRCRCRLPHEAGQPSMWGQAQCPPREGASRVWHVQAGLVVWSHP